MSEIDIDSLFIEPRPDEDAWEAFLDLALERIGGERVDGLTNRQIGDLEDVLGCQVPFEVGLLLVMGVPADGPWRTWTDPATEWPAWTDALVAGFVYDVEHHDRWLVDWGPKPTTSAGRHEAVVALLGAAPALFPVYASHAVPLVAAADAASSDGNPVLVIDNGQVAHQYDDLAAWMHREFNVPLPMWPAEERRFPFWSDLTT